MTDAGIFVRGFVIVALVALNVRNVAAGDYGAAFVTGCLISACWWLNAGLAGAARQRRSAVFGMWLGR
jgi:hypothetical protein